MGITCFYWILLTGISALKRYSSGLPRIWQKIYPLVSGYIIYILDSMVMGKSTFGVE